MKTRLLAVLLLAVVWVGLTGELKFINFIEGFFIGIFIILLSRHKIQAKSIIKKLPRVIRFILYFLYEVLRANLKVAYDIVTPTHYMKPGIIAYPLDAQTDIEITLLSNVITLTPGTLAIDISSDRSIMYIHSMYIYNVEDFISETKKYFEKPLLNIFR